MILKKDVLSKKSLLFEKDSFDLLYFTEDE